MNSIPPLGINTIMSSVATKLEIVPHGTMAYTLPLEDDLRCFRDTAPPAPDWVVEGLEPGDVGALTAPGGQGKSMLCLNLAIAVASGNKLFGLWDVSRAGDVVYLYAEDSSATMHRRFHAMNALEPRGYDNLVLSHLHFLNVRTRPPQLAIRGSQGLVLEQKDVLAALDQALSAIDHPRLIIMDPLVKFHALEENSNGEMDQYLTLLGSIAHQAQCAVIFTHHITKGRLSKNQESARGAGAIINEARWQAALSPLDDDELKLYGIDTDEAWRYLTLSTPKINGAAKLPTLLLERGEGGVLQYSLKTAGVPSDYGQNQKKSSAIDDYFAGMESSQEVPF